MADETIETDICVIGAGFGGLTVAQAAAAFGRSVVLIEKNKMGGSHLNIGCIPSKALLASAKRAQLFRSAAPFGIAPAEPGIDHRAVGQHVKSVIAAIAPNSSVERYAALGVRVILGAARFLDKRTVLAGDYRIRARRFVIATGSSPVIPAIPGLDQIPYFTNETIFENDKKLGHLIILGGGTEGLELAQAHRRLGSRVTVLESGRALEEDDPELTAVILKRLRAEGVEIIEGAAIERVETYGTGVRVRLASATTEAPIQAPIDGTHLLIAAGRRPNTSDLNLAAAGIRQDEGRIVVNRGLRTSNRRVYAIGDVTGAGNSTHLAEYHAKLVLNRALFWRPLKESLWLVPRVTLTDPEFAHVGMTEQQAAAKHIEINILRWPYSEIDRAQIERETEGHIKVITDRKGRILGATIAGAQAGELIQVWSLALYKGLNIKDMTRWLVPYPTLGEISTRAAERSLLKIPANRFVRKFINLLARLG